jgi:ABC-type multidrug transport system fused ATPase/permease subunit
MHSLYRSWQKSSIGRSIAVLSKKDQKKIFAVSVLQVLMGLLDLLGVIAIGLLGALSVSGLQSRQPSTRVASALDFVGISNLPFQTQATLLGVGAVILLVGRTILSIIFTRRILFFLSRRGAKISADLVSRLLAQPLLRVQERTTQETVYAITSGVSIITLQVLATAVVLLSDLALLLIMAVGLFVVDPFTSIGTFGIFFAIALLLYKFMHIRASELGIQSSELNIRSNEKIVEVFNSYRESVVRNRRDYYSREIGKLRYQLADASAEAGFLPYVSKYVIESSVILGALLIAAAQFITQDATHAVATLAIFLAAGTRIAPAVLRIQQGSIHIRGGLGAAMPTLDLITMLGDAPIIENLDDGLDVFHIGFVANISLVNVTLIYPNAKSPAVSGVSLEISSGSSVAIVGTSGAGKTTIIDVLLGVLSPSAGQVSISNMQPLEAIAKWPGAISYVPQDIVISAGTIRENVALGYPIDVATDELVMAALKIAQLDEFAKSLPCGIDTEVGERGAKLSGGQRQRLGIARAMFTQPHLLVLDEATSALDGETEAIISESIRQLRGSTTVVMIAHRLSTVRDADVVVYLSDGNVIATGSFEEVRKSVPDFDRQAKLMGL